MLGKQIGRIVSVIGTRSLSRSKAMSLSKLEKLNGCDIARNTKRVSGLVLSSHRSCSPNVTLIINHMKLERQNKKLFIKKKFLKTITALHQSVKKCIIFC